MPVHLTSLQEQRLQAVASKVHRSVDDVAQDAVDAFLAEYEDLVSAVREADEEFERGEFLSHEDVVASYQKRFAKA